MKTVFSEYYPICDEVINNAWDKGVFCYDANVLLNLYRYSNQTRNKIIENIEYFIGKTIMPYQACYEYHKNRRSVEDSLLNSYDEITKIINNAVNTLESGDLAKYRKHCALDIDKDIIKPIKSVTINITKKIKDTKSNHSSFLNVSEIHEKISQLFDGKVSDRFSEDDLKKIYAEGKNRYEKKIPPGFADYDNKKNQGENSLYGDLIIWKYLVEISKRENSDIIFVTDDRKKDWWDIHHGQTKGALPELYREFKELTSHNILIYSVEDYMKYAPVHSEIEVPRNVLNEIEELRKDDERRETYHDYNSIFTISDFLNKQNRVHENMNKQYEVLNALNNFTKVIHFSKSIGELSKSIQEINPNINCAKLIENIDKYKINNIFDNVNFKRNIGYLHIEDEDDDM